MTNPFRVVWTHDALEDWRRLSLADAERVARAVERFPHEGIAIATAAAEYTLFVGKHAVVLLLVGDTLHVDRVRRA
jgi:hypothetical protein